MEDESDDGPKMNSSLRTGEEPTSASNKLCAQGDDNDETDDVSMFKSKPGLDIIVGFSRSGPFSSEPDNSKKNKNACTVVNPLKNPAIARDSSTAPVPLQSLRDICIRAGNHNQSGEATTSEWEFVEDDSLLTSIVEGSDGGKSQRVALLSELLAEAGHSGDTKQQSSTGSVSSDLELLDNSEIDFHDHPPHQEHGQHSQDNQPKPSISAQSGRPLSSLIAEVFSDKVNCTEQISSQQHESKRNCTEDHQKKWPLGQDPESHSDFNTSASIFERKTDLSSLYSRLEELSEATTTKDTKSLAHHRSTRKRTYIHSRNERLDSLQANVIYCFLLVAVAFFSICTYTNENNRKPHDQPATSKHIAESTSKKIYEENLVLWKSLRNIMDAAGLELSGQNSLVDLVNMEQELVTQIRVMRQYAADNPHKMKDEVVRTSSLPNPASKSSEQDNGLPKDTKSQKGLFKTLSNSIDIMADNALYSLENYVVPAAEAVDVALMNIVQDTVILVDKGLEKVPDVVNTVSCKLENAYNSVRKFVLESVTEQKESSWFDLFTYF